MKPTCFNRPHYRHTSLVQDGWQEITIRDACSGLPVYTRVPKMKMIDNPMSKSCMQWTRLGEARLKGWDCEGCCHYEDALCQE